VRARPRDQTGRFGMGDDVGDFVSASMKFDRTRTRQAAVANAQDGVLQQWESRRQAVSICECTLAKCTRTWDSAWRVELRRTVMRCSPRTTARLVPVNFMLGADEVAYIITHSEAAGSGHRGRARTDSGQGPRLRRSRGAEFAAGSGLSGAAPTSEWENVDTWNGHGDPVSGRSADRRRRSTALMYTSGHGVAAQGRHAVEPLADRPVRVVRDRMVG